MKLEWLGQHRPLVETLFHWANRYAAVYRKKIPITDQVSLSASEIQVIEYLLENEELQLNMAGVARRLGISPVTFNDHAARLVRMGLLRRYRQADNNKNTILLVTPEGREVYAVYSARLQENWSEMLRLLDEIPEEYCDKFRQAIDCLLDESVYPQDAAPCGLTPIDPENP